MIAAKLSAAALLAAALLFVARPAVPAGAAILNPAQIANSGPAAVLRLDSPGNRLLPERPEWTTLLVVGGALMGFGLVGRKRRSQRASAGD